MFCGDRVWPPDVLSHVYHLMGDPSAASVRCWVTCQTRGIRRMSHVLECSEELRRSLTTSWCLTSQHSARLTRSTSCVMYYVLHRAGLRAAEGAAFRTRAGLRSQVAADAAAAATARGPASGGGRGGRGRATLSWL